MNFLNYSVYWSPKTLALYIGIIAVCFFIAGRRRRYLCFDLKGIKAHKYDYRLILISIILLFFKGFGTTGRDLRSGYYINFLTASSMENYKDQTVEFGFRGLNVVIYNIFGQYWVLVFVVAVLTIIPVIYLLNKYSDDIDLPVSVLMYTTIFYFTSFSGYRQYLAVSISLLAFDAIREKRMLKALLWIGVSMSFHFSMIFLFVPYFLILFKYLSKKMITASLVVMFMLTYLLRGTLSAMLVGRYSIYSMFNNVDFGMKYIVYYIPLFILFLIGMKRDDDKYFSRVSITYLGTGFVFALLEYIISILGRIQAGTIPIIFIAAYYIKRIKTKSHSYRHLINLILILYCALRFWVFISETYNQEDLMPYTNIFGMFF